MKYKVLGVIFLVAIAAAVVSGVYYWQVYKNAQNPVTLPVHKDADDTVFCGGFAGTSCPTDGYDCEPEANYPDAMTICKRQN